MALHVDSGGEGPDLVILHGWGLHGGVFDALAKRLAPRFRVHRPDLPGHGRSAGAAAEGGLDGWAQAVHDALVPRLAGPALWVGWSLGGMVALQVAARFPAQTRALAMVAASPRFTTAPGWPHAVAGEVLDGFARDLESDYRGTLLRFIALQARGAPAAREEIRWLRERVFAHGEPTPAALGAGLQILREADLRPTLAELRVPLLLLGGARDTLVPGRALRAAAGTVSRARAVLIPGAGHAPFLSHPEAFDDELEDFARGG